jgi:hypothetical protein
MQAGINSAPTTVIFIDLQGRALRPTSVLKASSQKQITRGRKPTNFKQAVIETHDRKI